ncbi:MAG: hypothetical protein JRG92_13900 [Deltaproteobacteria bacterium]|nr:hypothetical protein [Deltaproteobacteria bacterium]
MQEGIDGYRSRGAQVIAIGQGTGVQAAHYASKWNVDLPILGDVKAAAYQAYGMLRGSWWTVVVRSMIIDPIETLRLIAKADMTGAALPAADVLRLPGMAIVEKGGRLRFLHRAEETKDMPENATVFEKLDQLGKAAGV